MDIRFCDRCAESIPDSDFDTGRAVTVDRRHYHVNCALSRSLALNGPRSWLTFLLVLYAAGVATYLLASELGKEEKPDVVTSVVQARIDERVSELEVDVRRNRARALEAAGQENTRQRTADAKSLRDSVEKGITALGARIDETDRLAHDRASQLDQKILRTEKEIADLNALVRAAIERAEDEASRRVAATPAAVPPPVAPTVNPPDPAPAVPPTPPVATTPRDPDHDQQVERWIKRLKDSNENIRFSATLELGRLKDLRAAAPLIDVLEDDRDYYVRLGAATALGDMKACDAVPALIEALNDKDTLVRTAANDALQAITGQTFEFVTEMSKRQRSKAMKQWRDWWKANEEGVRRRLGQPAA